MKLKNIVLSALFPLSALIACGGSASDSGDGGGDGDGDAPTTPATSAAGKDATCEEFCTTLESCEGVDTTSCVEDCTANDTTSRAGQEAITECFDADLCEATSETELAGALLCLIGESSDIELSGEGETYCNETVGYINGCLDSQPPEDLPLSCSDSVGLASDELLEGLNECGERDCADVETCVFLSVIDNVDIQAFLDLESGGSPSPAVMADLITIALVYGQLGLDDTGGGFGDFTSPPPTGMGGSSF